MWEVTDCGDHLSQLIDVSCSETVMTAWTGKPTMMWWYVLVVNGLPVGVLKRKIGPNKGGYDTASPYQHYEVKFTSAIPSAGVQLVDLFV